MLLNKIPVLDKGYVALIDSCNTTQKLRDIGEEFFGGTYPTSLEELGSMTVVMKCPLFIQLSLSKFNFKVIDANTNSRDAQADFYLPNAGEICAKQRDVCEIIADDIARTTAALQINPAAYQADGADRFISQVTTPISIYTTILVQGSYGEWCKWAYQQSFLPAPISAYTAALQQIITAEWK